MLSQVLSKTASQHVLTIIGTRHVFLFITSVKENASPVLVLFHGKCDHM